MPSVGAVLPPANAKPVGLSHVVHFYQEDRVLITELSRLLGTALSNGDAALVVASNEHAEALRLELVASRIDVASAQRMGRYVCLEADETLSRFMVDLLPDREKFLAIFGEIIKKCSEAKAKDGTVVIFGEMVARLFADGNHEGAIRLEELWNELGREHSFFLRCAYPMAGFNKAEHGELFMKICAEHSTVVPHQGNGLILKDEDRGKTIARLQQQLLVLEHEKALRESEQRFRLLVEAVQDYAIFMLDEKGLVSSWNTGAERMKGYKEREVLGKHFSSFYPAADIATRKPHRALEIAARDGRFEDEGWRVRKDGSMFWANVIITVLKNEAGVVIGFSKVTRDITEKMRAQQALEAAQRSLQESESSMRQLSRHLLRTQEEERRRIGRELHDSVGQYLSALKMRLDVLNRTSEPPSKQIIAEHLSECSDLADEAIKDVRTISYLLYPPLLEEIGLNSAMAWYLDGFSQRSCIVSTFTADCNIGRLPEDIEVALFRILQECLTNVHRHSGSPSADVRLFAREGVVHLEVSDKGHGMSALVLEEKGQDWIGTFGVGLRGMNERIRQLGGKLELVSGPQGTSITASILWTPPAQSEQPLGVR